MNKTVLLSFQRKQPACLPAFSALTGLALGLASIAQGADWPQYRGPNHDGASAEKILKSWPATGLKKLWNTPLNSGFSSFTVGQGKAFTIVRRVGGGADQEVCVALDAATGKEAWSRVLGQAKYQGGGDSGTPDNRGGDGPRSTPTLDGGRVYALSAYLQLNCYAADSGQPVWNLDLLKEYGGKLITWQSAASPLIDGDLIFIHGVAPGQCLMAFNKQDGKLVWKGQNDLMTHATPVAATISGVRQVIFFAQSGLVAVAPLTGEVLWRYKFPYNVSTAASPVVGGDIVYCSAGYDVGAGAVKISQADGKFIATELWRRPKAIMSHWNTPVYHEGHLYGLFGCKDYGKAPLQCVDIKTGEEKWTKTGFGPGGLLLVDGRLLILDDRGNLVLAKATPEAFQEEGRFKAVDGKCWNVPALSNGRLYARSTKEGACFDISVQNSFNAGR